MPDSETTTTTATAPGDPATTATTTTADAALGDAGKRALDAERSRAESAEKEAKRLQKILDDAEAQRRKDQEAEAARKGEFEQLAAQRERERDEIKDEAASLRGQLDQFRAAIDGLLATEWNSLPSEVRDAFAGADDDALAKLAWLPKGKALAEKLAAKDPAARGNGPDPKGTGSGMPSVSDTANEYRRMLRVR